MPGFLYYIPGRDQSITLDECAKLGLAYAFERPPATRGCRGGPDGKDGVILADDRRLSEIGYFPARQLWRIAPTAKFWVGMPAGIAIAPEDLARGKQLSGHSLALLDGASWLVPIARGYIDEDGDLRWYTALPQRARLGADGKWGPGEVLARYAAVWELANAWNETRSGAPIEEDDQGRRRQVLSFDGLLSAAVEALAVNYLLGPIETDLLGLLSEDLAAEVLDRLVDMPTRLEWVKKKLAAEAAGASTAAGPAGSTAATAPA